MKVENLNRYFDHTNLKPEAIEKDIIKLCEEAVKYTFYSVVVNPVLIPIAKNELTGTDIKITSVAGFPTGAGRTDVKITEAIKAVKDGADEIDMVANIGALVSNQHAQVENEIKQIRQSLPYNIILKVIIEAGKLTEAQQIDAVKAVINGGAQYVKTSTGFFGGATVDQVKTLFKASEGKIEVKAAGGIRTLNDCYSMIHAGAARIGCSSSVVIIKEWHNLSTAK